MCDEELHNQFAFELYKEFITDCLAHRFVKTYVQLAKLLSAFLFNGTNAGELFHQTGAFLEELVKLFGLKQGKHPGQTELFWFICSHKVKVYHWADLKLERLNEFLEAISAMLIQAN